MNSDNVKYEYGCLMAIIDPKSSKKIVEINKKLIPDNILYLEEGQEYGREIEPHITIKFGLTENYSNENMKKLISHIKPFKVMLESLNIFSNPKYDVVKFNIKSKMLEKLNELLNTLPNEDQYKIYSPHLTLAYVYPGLGKNFIREIKPVNLLISRIKYSNPIGKYYYDL